MLDISMTKIRLQCPGIVASVGERVATSMPKHVRVRFEAERCLDPCPLDHAGEACACERRSTL